MCTNRCSFGEGISIKPDGINELDPCVYKEIEKYAVRCLKTSWQNLYLPGVEGGLW